MTKKSSGFTLIELVVVIGILAVLLAIVLIAINPAKQFAAANNTKRRSDVSAILNAVGQYSANHEGNLPSGIPSTTPDDISTAGTAADFCTSLVPTYISALPTDPTDGVTFVDCTDYDTGYQIVQNGGRVTVSAPSTNHNDDSAPVGYIEATR